MKHSLRAFVMLFASLFVTISIIADDTHYYYAPSFAENPEYIVALVEFVESEFTKHTTCRYRANEICVSWWHKNHFVVRSVIKGKLERKRIAVMNLQHGEYLLPKHELIMLVLKKPTGDEAQQIFDTNYFTENMTRPKTMYCFDAPKYLPKVDVYPNQAQGCFAQDEFTDHNLLKRYIDSAARKISQQLRRQAKLLDYSERGYDLEVEHRYLVAESDVALVKEYIGAALRETTLSWESLDSDIFMGKPKDGVVAVIWLLNFSGEF